MNLFTQPFIQVQKTSKIRVTGLCEGTSPVTSDVHAQRASNAENASIWWRYHVQKDFYSTGTWLFQKRNINPNFVYTGVTELYFVTLHMIHKPHSTVLLVYLHFRWKLNAWCDAISNWIFRMSADILLFRERFSSFLYWGTHFQRCFCCSPYS